MVLQSGHKLVFEKDDLYFGSETPAKILRVIEGAFLIVEPETPIMIEPDNSDRSKDYVAIIASADRYNLVDGDWDFMGVVVYTVSSETEKILNPIGRAVVWSSVEARQRFFEQLQ